MKNRVLIETSFHKSAKRLAKRYVSFPQDLLQLIEKLELDALLGVSLGGNLRKIRMSIRSKGKGKSGGARMITYVRIIKNTVYLMDIYDKAEQANISDKELLMLIDLLSQE